MYICIYICVYIYSCFGNYCIYIYIYYIFYTLLYIQLSTYTCIICIPSCSPTKDMFATIMFASIP